MKSLQKNSSAVDLGSRTIKGISLQRKKGSIIAESAFFHDLSESNDQYPENTQREEKLRAMVETKGIKHKKVFSMLENNEVAQLSFNLPEMPDSEIDLAVKNEIEEQLNVSSDEIAYDYLCEKIEVEGITQFQISLYWVRRDFLEAMLALFEKAELEALAIEPAVTAHISMLEFNGYLAFDKNYVLLDIGESHTSLTLLHGSKVVFTHCFPMGGRHLNQNLMEGLGMSYQEAESQKQSLNIDLENPDVSEASSLVSQGLFEILKSVKESFDFANAQSPGIEAIYFVGGLSYAKNLGNSLQNMLGVSVQNPNPFRNIGIHEIPMGETLKEKAYHFSLAVGLALRGLE